MLTSLLTLVVVALICMTFYTLGMYHERREWNKLIEKGIIPPPVVAVAPSIKREPKQQ